MGRWGERWRLGEGSHPVLGLVFGITHRGNAHKGEWGGRLRWPGAPARCSPDPLLDGWGRSVSNPSASVEFAGLLGIPRATAACPRSLGCADGSLLCPHHTQPMAGSSLWDVWPPCYNHWISEPRSLCTVILPTVRGPRGRFHGQHTGVSGRAGKFLWARGLPQGGLQPPCC